MNKLNKETKNRLKDLLSSYMVDEYQKTLIKAILRNSENKNLSLADLEVTNDLLRKYK